VLDGMDGDRVFAELRLSLRQNSPFGQRWNGGAIGQIRSPKEDTGSRHGWPEGQPAFGAEVEADTLKGDWTANGTTIHPANIAKLSQRRDLATLSDWRCELNDAEAAEGRSSLRGSSC